MNYPRKALEVLGTYGWHKGSLGNREVGFCIGGALLASSASLYDEETERSAKAVVDTIREQYPDRFDVRNSYVIFNDHPDTQVEDVIRVLEKAAVKMDEVCG